MKIENYKITKPSDTVGFTEDGIWISKKDLDVLYKQYSKFEAHSYNNSQKGNFRQYAGQRHLIQDILKLFDKSGIDIEKDDITIISW